MRVLNEGEEFLVEHQERWLEFDPKVGTILEVDATSTDLAFPPGLWLPFVVMGVSLEDDATMLIEAKFVGSEEADVNKEMSKTFNKRKSYLHLCGGKPCLSSTEGVGLHVTRFRVFSVEGYKRDFLTPSMVRQMKKWAGVTAADPAPEFPPQPPRRSALAKPKGSKGPKEGGGGDGTKEVSRLSSRLSELRHRLHAARPGTGGQVEAPDAAGDVEELNSSTEDASGLESTALDTGTELGPALTRGPWDSFVKATTKRKASKQSRKIQQKDHGHRSGGREDRKIQLAISDGSSRGMHSQLAIKAAAVASEKARGKERSKRSKESSIGKQLLKILTEKKGRRKSGSSKDRKKKKSHRRRIKPDPDGPGDGPTWSSDSSYSSDWESREGSLSDEDEMEPPLRKRAKQHPGSVLKMLLAHARSQLDQSSKVALEPSSSLDVTSGVKMASYFSIVVKPGLQQNVGAQRDLHLLSVAIDLLRQGDLTLLGDCLASRFVAIHQAAVDGGWGAARHLELFPMEDGGAANNAVLLEPRRHAKLAAKAAGIDNYNWKGRGKGKKGKKGKWEDNPDFAEKGGKKGNQKGSQKQWWGQGDGNKWKENKETPNDKKS